MANLLTQLIFVKADSAQQNCHQLLQHKHSDAAENPVCLPACFMQAFSFPCHVQTTPQCIEPTAVCDSALHAQVLNIAYGTPAASSACT